jgi:hypothetical protein
VHAPSKGKGWAEAHAPTFASSADTCAIASKLPAPPRPAAAAIAGGSPNQTDLILA